MRFQSLALVREKESLENPGSLEKRVALFPEDLAPICRSGIKVFVEEGAGWGMDIPDSAYIDAGAEIQNPDRIYKDKDLIVKFKGPALDSISQMRPNSTLFCMAHFKSFPARAEKLQKQRINVIAMEHVLENPRKLRYELLLSSLSMEALISTWEQKDPFIHFLGYLPRYTGAIRYAGRHSTKPISLLQEDISMKELGTYPNFNPQDIVYVYHTEMGEKLLKLVEELRRKSYRVYNLEDFEKEASSKVQSYYESKEKKMQGMRRIECLHETGQAGARYGFTLLRENSSKKLSGDKVRAFVLGYGNVGIGAIHECYLQGVRHIQILNRHCSKASVLEKMLPSMDLIINGAEPKPKKFLLTKAQSKSLLTAASVVIDLIGGSAHNRSPVEDILETNYLSNPYFERNGRFFSSLWGWPMMGMMRESNLRYSPQIRSVLLEEEKLLMGLKNLSPGLLSALVCGPFYTNE